MWVTDRALPPRDRTWTFFARRRAAPKWAIGRMAREDVVLLDLATPSLRVGLADHYAVDFFLQRFHRPKNFVVRRNRN